jgi:hypothetical protein
VPERSLVVMEEMGLKVLDKNAHYASLRNDWTI